MLPYRQAMEGVLMLLGVGLASTVRAELLRCTARQELVLKRPANTRRDRTRAIDRHDRKLKRWHSGITPALRKGSGSRSGYGLGQGDPRRRAKAGEACMGNMAALGRVSSAMLPFQMGAWLRKGRLACAEPISNPQPLQPGTGRLRPSQ
jgi:hypothetical protein